MPRSVEIRPNGQIAVVASAAAAETGVSLDGIVFGVTDDDWAALALPAAYSVPNGWTVPAMRRIGDTVYLRGLVTRNDGQSLGDGETFVTVSNRV